MEGSIVAAILLPFLVYILARASTFAANENDKKKALRVKVERKRKIDSLYGRHDETG